MKSGTALAAAVFALTSFPILAQQPSPATQPSTPPTQTNPAAQQSPAPPSSPAAAEPTQEPAQQNAPSPGAQAPAGPMSPVSGELESRLDSKTAKTGDNVVVRTKSSAKTADGTEIPKGSKLMGHVIAVQPSAAGATSQMVLQFDRIELKGGQSMTIRSQIQSISPAGSAEMASGAAPISPAPASGNPSPAMSPATNNAQRSSAAAPQAASDAGASPAASGAPAPGTVVAKNGNIAIETTAVPGILLANNAPGQQDPRMAKASSILLGAKRDIQLDGGTQMVVGVSAAGQ